MTQNAQRPSKVTEFNALFLALDEKSKDQALAMLRSLEYAQSVIRPRKDGRVSKMESTT